MYNYDPIRDKYNYDPNRDKYYDHYGHAKIKKGFVHVADVLGLGPERLWYYIPGFNGYELSNDGYIRSMKHYKRYPYGILIHPLKNTKDSYVLSNDNNERITVRLDEIKKLVENDRFKRGGYPRKTHQCDRSSRNPRVFIKRDVPDLRIHREVEDILIDPTRQFMPSFTIIPDSQQEIKKICPIYDISGRGQYYGR